MTDNEKILVDDMFDTWRYTKGSYVEMSFRGYYHKPDDLYTIQELSKSDKAAMEDIKKLESKIETLKAYRTALYDRSQEVVCAETSKKVVLSRYKGYGSDGRVVFYLKLIETYPDGHEMQNTLKKYGGKERRLAISEYNSYIKDHPGIICEMDIEKSWWEK